MNVSVKDVRCLHDPSTSVGMCRHFQQWKEYAQRFGFVCSFVFVCFWEWLKNNLSSGNGFLG